MKTTKTFTVYRHITQDGKSYIGCTSKKRPEKRWKNGLGYRRQIKIREAIEKWGWDNIEHQIISTNLTEKEAKWLENYLICYYRTFILFEDCNGYNMNLGGDGQVGVINTEEYKKKQSEKQKGRPSNRKDYHHSEETRKKISSSNIGKPSHNKGKHLVMIDGKRHYE